MTTKRRRKWPWFLGGAVLLAAILVVAVPYIYIHFIQSDPPSTLTFENIDAGAGSATTTPSSSATTASGDASASADDIEGTWGITTGSQAGYRVKEVLFGQDTDAVGRTEAVTGTLNISGSAVTDGSFAVDMKTIQSDEGRRDSEFQGHIMETSKFPQATFKLTQPIDLGSLPPDKTEVTYTAAGDLTLHGVTRSVQVALTARRNGANIEVTGTIPVLFSDYGISNPSTGAVTTQDNGVVEFFLVFAKS